MKNPLQSPLAITLTALLALAFGAQTSAASPDDDKAFRKQAKACIAEIGTQIDYGRASRAKHAVVSTGQTLEGQATLQIETSLISGRRDKVIKKYSTSCVVGESTTVARIDITEVDAAAPATSIAHSK